MFEFITKYFKVGPSIAMLEPMVGPDSVINYESAYNKISIVRRAVDLLCDSCASIKFVCEDDNLAKILNKRPNAFQSSSRFWREAYLDYILTGDMFLAIGTEQLNVLPAQNTTIIPDARAFVKAYEYDGGLSKTIVFPPDEIILKTYTAG